MLHRRYETFNEAYYSLINAVINNGEVYGPRGFTCVELRPASFIIAQPQFALYTGKSRKLNYRFFALEALTYLAGWGDTQDHVELLCSVNREMKRFVNPQSGLFDGAYGNRLAESLVPAYERLCDDPETRQAVCAIWTPGIPPALSRDIPCTVALHFYKQGIDAAGKRPRLGLTAMMRSNDLILGTPYDVAAFCTLQRAMASALNWSLGEYTHIADILHIYTDNVGTVVRPSREDFSWGPQESLPGFNGQRHLSKIVGEAGQFCDLTLLNWVRGTNAWSEFATPLPGDWQEWASFVRFGRGPRC